MDLSLATEDQAFRNEVVAFIEENLADDMIEANRLTSGIFAEIEIGRVPIANRVGEENDGWTVAKYLLEFERGGSAYGPGLDASLAKVRAMAAAEPADGGALIKDASFKARLDAAEIEVRAIDATEQRLMSAMSQGQNPGTSSSMLKIRGSEVNQRVSELGIEAIAHYGFPFQPEARVPGNNVEAVGPAHAVPTMPRYLNLRAHSIYAGSNEIQRNIMAKLVLGL